MLPYPPAVERDAAQRSLMRVVGGVLALLSILLALLCIIFHQGVADLVLAIIAGLFGVRVLLLWLGTTPQHYHPLPAWSSTERYAMGAPLSPRGQPTPSLQSRPLTRLAAEQHRQPGLLPPPPRLPRSVRPQRQPGAAALPARFVPLPQSGAQPHWPSQPAAVPLPTPAPVSPPSGQEIWHYDDENREREPQRGNDHGPSL